jgi:hypothetical protein
LPKNPQKKKKKVVKKVVKKDPKLMSIEEQIEA